MSNLKFLQNNVKTLFLNYQNNNAILEIGDEEVENLLEYHKLDMAYYSLCSSKHSQHLSEKRSKIVKKNIYYYLELKKIVKRFEDRNIDYVILKGWAALISLYRHIEDRYFNDVDILVCEKDLVKVEEILFSCGFQYGKEKNRCIMLADRKKILFQRRYTHELYNMVKEVDDNCFLNIDINFRFSWKGMNDNYIGQTGYEKIHFNRVGVIYRGTEFRILDKELQFIHLCCHFFNEANYFLLNNEFVGGDPCELRLFRLLDIFLLLPSIDFDKVKKMIDEFSCERQVDYVMKILSIILDNEKVGLGFVRNFDVEINKYFTREKEWEQWPLSIRDRVFMISKKEEVCKILF